ncbi:MAG: DUF488 domain-containing protein [Nitrososphaerota archaeon]
MFKIKRAYDKPAKDDGYRVLVDRIWPRGLSKESARIDLWMREIAPSTGLRKWFGHDPSKWPVFKARYEKELDSKSAFIEDLLNLEKMHGVVTLLYGARDTEHNNAVVLKEYLETRKKGGS